MFLRGRPIGLTGVALIRETMPIAWLLVGLIIGFLVGCWVGYSVGTYREE